MELYGNTEWQISGCYVTESDAKFSYPMKSINSQKPFLILALKCDCYETLKCIRFYISQMTDEATTSYANGIQDPFRYIKNI